MLPSWSTACPDWEARIVAGQSLIPFDPLFPEEADAGLKVFESMRLVDLPGRPMLGDMSRPWISDLIRAFFGAYDAETGVRLINDIHIDIAKKNIKSTLAAALMLTCLIRNWRESGEFYVLAPTKEIADNSFLPMRDMVRADSSLTQIMHVQENQRTITHRQTKAFVKVIAADSETVGGKKTIGLFVDELWLFGKRAGAEAMLREAKGGLASRPEGFVISASTKPDGPPAGVYAQRLEYFRGVRDGKIEDPQSLAILYEYPKRFLDDESFKKPEYFYIPNPNLGASVSKDYLAAEFAKAERAGRASLINFCAKHLNVEPGQSLRSDGWAGAAVWPRGADPTLTLNELLDRCEVIAIGIDGGGLDDLLGVAVVGREKNTGRWLAWAHGLISTVGCWRRKANAEDYLRFKKAGELTIFRFGHADEDIAEEETQLADLFDGVPPADPDPKTNPPDIQYVVDLVQRIHERGLLAQVGVDAAGIGAIIDALAKIGVTQDAGLLEGVRQGIGLMGAIKTVERMLADGRFRHGAQLLLSWCVSNIKIVQTATAMRAARDESGYGKVDPAMAMFNAVALMSLNPEAQGSVYTAERGLIVFA
jgi:phage terminase large subunit-like protein